MAAKSRVLDDLIMGTNSSSIVSKRSVERLYYPNEPHFFRHFVKKFQRRAPLINRGYWLRLRAIDVVVRHFIVREPTKRKVVINLGCGSDVIPWQCHARYGSASSNVLFVDVDYPDLIRKKRAVVLGTPHLRDLLGSAFDVSDSDNDGVLLRSDTYCQVACDLRDLDAFRRTLESFLDLGGCEVLFVAEVSITYMDTQSADALIEWASSIGQAEFCLLEQILPQGPNHPFAKTMLAHFDKLSTPPKSVGQYQTLDAQASRFGSRGWNQVHIWDLWQAWESGLFVSDTEKLALDDVEPFDEWEEFILFGRHYFILHASASEKTSSIAKLPVHQQVGDQRGVVSQIEITSWTPSKVLKRRFGNIMNVTNPLGQPYLVHAMGLDTNGRAATCDVFSLGLDGPAPTLPLQGPLARVCYSLTDLGDSGVMLIGGRTSPTVPLPDCWLFDRGIHNRWTSMPSLPVPLFRHSAVRLKSSSLVLVGGGKTGPSSISGDFYLFHPGRGWDKCQVSGSVPEAAFGSILCNSSSHTSRPGVFHGLLAGGLNKLGHIVGEKYLWCMDTTGSQPVISFEVSKDSGSADILSVFGTQVVEVDSKVVLCGGVGPDASIQGCNISTMTVLDGNYQFHGTFDRDAEGRSNPFMIGSSAIRYKDDIVIVGGGATCFSMGTFWETDIYRIRLNGSSSSTASTLSLGSEHSAQPEIRFLESHKHIVMHENDARPPNGVSTINLRLNAIPRFRLDSAEQLQEVLDRGKPVILESVNLGRCLGTWTPQIMAEQVGSDKKVIIHECHESSEKMDFNSKNFSYVEETFGNVMTRVQSGDRIYLRSLSQSRPAEMPAKIEEDFPALAADFCLPPELAYVKEYEFSSVLRVSGRVNMWLHYDVMANIYSQIIGSKRMILFPPSDVKHLMFAPGASSSSLDVFSALDAPSSSSSSSSLSQTHPHEALLHPGDVLFIPSLWLHTGSPQTDANVAVNVFFRNLDNAHYSRGRDVYGNRDLEAYEKGRQAVARIGKAFEQVPQEAKRFYLSRIADELVRAAEKG